MKQPRRMDGRTFAMAALLCLLAAASPAAAADTPAASGAAAAPDRVPVSVARAQRQDVPVYLDGIGTVQPFYSVLVRARVDGTLQRFVPTEGQVVRKGDLIAVIDPRPYQAILAGAVAKKAQSEAQSGNARRDLGRYTALAQREFASRQQVDSQKASVDQYAAAIQADQAAIDAAELNLSFCYITAPIDGRVGLRLVDPGNLVHAGDTGGIVTIAQEQPIALVFTLPQSRLPAIVEAMAARSLPVQALAGESRAVLDTGTLLTPDNAIDPATGTIRLKATFPNAAGRLWPGQFVQARLLLRTEAGAVTVPMAAIQHGPDGEFVYGIGPNDKVERTKVVLGPRDGGTVAVREGVADGALVLVGGQSRVQAGTPVSYADPAAPKPAAAASPTAAVAPPASGRGG